MGNQYFVIHAEDHKNKLIGELFFAQHRRIKYVPGFGMLQQSFSAPAEVTLFTLMGTIWEWPVAEAVQPPVFKGLCNFPTSPLNYRFVPVQHGEYEGKTVVFATVTLSSGGRIWFPHSMWNTQPTVCERMVFAECSLLI